MAEESVGTGGYGRAMRHAWVGSIRVRIAESRRDRRRGLLGPSVLRVNDGLLLIGCRSIHTIGMRFAIDAVLLDRRFRVLAIVSMPPGRLLLPRPGVRHILEVAPRALRCAPGLRLRIVDLRSRLAGLE
jgi:uncharacterized membrane protein (UPF0127 family)